MKMWQDMCGKSLRKKNISNLTKSGKIKEIWMTASIGPSQACTEGTHPCTAKFVQCFNHTHRGTMDPDPAAIHKNLRASKRLCGPIQILEFKFRLVSFGEEISLKKSGKRGQAGSIKNDKRQTDVSQDAYNFLEKREERHLGSGCLSHHGSRDLLQIFRAPLLQELPYLVSVPLLGPHRHHRHQRQILSRWHQNREEDYKCKRQKNSTKWNRNTYWDEVEKRPIGGKHQIVEIQTHLFTKPQPRIHLTNKKMDTCGDKMGWFWKNKNHIDQSKWKEGTVRRNLGGAEFKTAWKN